MRCCNYISTIFKKIRQLACIAVLSASLLACPFSSPYKLDADPIDNIDRECLGKWATMVTTNTTMMPVKVIISEKSEKEYNIEIIGPLKEVFPYQQHPGDSLHGTASVSTILDRKFLNLQILGQTYITEIILAGNRLSLLPLAECFTAKYIKTGAELRTAVEFHFKTRLWPMYDADFSLKEMVRVN